MDSAVAPIRGKEFRKRVAKVIADKRGDNIFVTYWNDKKVVSSCGVKVVLPARAGVSAGLRISGGWRLVFLVLHQLLDRRVLVRDLSVQDHGQLFIVHRIP